MLWIGMTNESNGKKTHVYSSIINRNKQLESNLSRSLSRLLASPKSHSAPKKSLVCARSLVSVACFSIARTFCPPVCYSRRRCSCLFVCFSLSLFRCCISLVLPLSLIDRPCCVGRKVCDGSLTQPTHTAQRKGLAREK